MSFPLGNRLRFRVRVGAAGDVATQIASDLRPRVEGHYASVRLLMKGSDPTGLWSFGDVECRNGNVDVKIDLSYPPLLRHLSVDG